MEHTHWRNKNYKNLTAVVWFCKTLFHKYTHCLFELLFTFYACSSIFKVIVIFKLDVVD